MSRRERVIIAGILFLISAMTILDIMTDAREGVPNWHTLIEALVALSALSGVYFLLEGTFKLKKSLESERKLSSDLQRDAKNWKEHSRKYIRGLSESIDVQLTKWELTKAEKEVAFLLLKGFSLKEIADYRKTSEKTARAQSTTIYSKARLAGRSQLSAFFLEDLLLPQDVE